MWWEEVKQWSQMSQERKSEGKDVGWKDDKENRKKSGARGRPAFPSLRCAALQIIFGAAAGANKLCQARDCGWSVVSQSNRCHNRG